MKGGILRGSYIWSSGKLFVPTEVRPGWVQKPFDPQQGFVWLQHFIGKHNSLRMCVTLGKFGKADDYQERLGSLPVQH